jgi:hypothetical protein
VFAPHPDEISALQLLQMMGKRGGGDAKPPLEVIDYHSVRMCSEQKLHDPKTSLGTHGSEDAGQAMDVACDRL